MSSLFISRYKQPLQQFIISTYILFIYPYLRHCSYVRQQFFQIIVIICMLDVVGCILQSSGFELSFCRITISTAVLCVYDYFHLSSSHIFLFFRALRVLHSLPVISLSITSVVVGLSCIIRNTSTVVFVRLITSNGGGNVHPHNKIHIAVDLLIGRRIVTIFIRHCH